MKFVIQNTETLDFTEALHYLILHVLVNLYQYIIQRSDGKIFHISRTKDKLLLTAFCLGMGGESKQKMKKMWKR